MYDVRIELTARMLRAITSLIMEEAGSRSGVSCSGQIHKLDVKSGQNISFNLKAITLEYE